MNELKSYKQLIVWQKSMDLAVMIYRITEDYPKSELYGLVSQTRRSAVSIPSNIAEGFGRTSSKEYDQFYAIAYGSLLELETQIILAKKLSFIKVSEDTHLESLIIELSKMLHSMVIKCKKLSPKYYLTNN